MKGESEHQQVQIKSYLVGQQEQQKQGVVVPSRAMANREKRPTLINTFVLTEDEPVHIPSNHVALPHKSESVINNDTSNASTHNIATGDVIASSTRDTIVVMITLTIILFTLIATYFLWRKRRRSFASTPCNRLEEYRYSRLSQNDVEVDNISFQGDLTHKSLLNAVPVCVEEEGEDDRMKPATLCLEYDSLITISNEDSKSDSHRKNVVPQTSTMSDVTPMNVLIGELSDEDLLQ